jgi:hypothetical protein
VSVKASSEAVAPLAGMPLSFSIENEGVLKAHSAKYRCYFGHIQSSFPPQVTMSDNDTSELPLADVLLPRDPIEVSCPGVFSPPEISIRVAEADVAVLVSFRPSFDWRRSSACGRYILRKNAANQLAWFRKSSEPCEELARCLNKRDADLSKYRVAIREYVKNMRRGKSAEIPTAPSAISCAPRE